MAEANGTETPQTRTVPEHESTVFTDTAADRSHNERRLRLLAAKKGSPNGSAAPINRFLLPRSYTLSLTPHPL